MKTLTRSLLLLLCSLFSLFYSAKAQNVNVQITASDTIGACRANNFQAVFNASNGQVLRIQASVSSTPPLTITCGTTPSAPHVYIVVNNQSAFSNILIDTANGIWEGTFNSTILNYTLNYNIYIDCSIFQYTNNANINLDQSWTAPGQSYNYNLNTSGNNTHQVANITSLSLSNISSTVFYGTYTNTTDQFFRYINTSTVTADIQIWFQEDMSNYCGLLPNYQLHYSKSINGTFTPLNSVTWTNISILNPGDTLYIRQRVQVDTCLNSCAAGGTALFRYRCNYTLPSSNVFCSNCQNIPQLNYQVVHNENQNVQVDMIQSLIFFQ